MDRLRSLWCLLILFGCADSALAATTAYRCQGPAGVPIFQDSPCPKGQREQVLQLKTPPAPAAASSAPATPAPSAPQPQIVLHMTTQAPAVVPTMYRCARGTDGTTYISRNGQPQPYLVPLYVTGLLERSVGQREAMNGHGVYGSDLIGAPFNTSGGPYTWVQDHCQALPQSETCERLRDERDDNERQLDHAFKSDRAPFEQKAVQLRQDLAGC